MPDECVDCQNAKEEAHARESATPVANDGLRLGRCAPIYRKWADCIRERAGQAKECASVMDEFKLCHNAMADQSLLDATLRR